MVYFPAMQQPFDPGLTQSYSGRLRRMVNRDGSFNVHRRGGSLRDLHRTRAAMFKGPDESRKCTCADS